MLKTFEDFSNREFKYIFYIPITFESSFTDNDFWKMYYGDLENTIDRIEDEYGIDLYWLKNDFEYFLRNKESENEDEYVDEEDAFDEFMQDINLTDDAETKYIEPSKYKIRELEREMIDDFNESKLEQYIDNRYKSIKPIIKSIRMTEWIKKYIGDSNWSAVVDVISKEPLELNELKDVKEYLEGQCSDGWGEGFSQQEFYNIFTHAWDPADWYEITYSE